MYKCTYLCDSTNPIYTSGLRWSGGWFGLLYRYRATASRFPSVKGGVRVDERRSIVGNLS